MKIRTMFLMSAVVFLILVGCAPKDYIAEVNGMIVSSQTEFNEISADSSLSDDEKTAKMETVFNKLQDKVKSISTVALKKHNDDSVAVFMVDALAQLEIYDAKTILKLIDKLGPNAQGDALICAYKEKLSMPEQAPQGSKFIDFVAKTPEGRKARLSDYVGKGSYCLVDFWASWCGPCRREIPNLIEVYEKYADKGLTMLSVAVWDKTEDSKAAAEELGICWNQMVGAGNVPTDLYGIDGIPHIILFGPDGTIIKRDLRGRQIMKAVSKVL